MSIASDILKAAVDRSHAVHAKHAEHVSEVFTSFGETLKKPWKGRVEAIGEAVATVREIVDGNAPKEPPTP